MSFTRRAFVASLAALGVLPGIVRAQRGLRTIAWFGIGGPDDFLPYLNGLQNGLREAGSCASPRCARPTTSSR